jgi:hypothetical protein
MTDYRTVPVEPTDEMMRAFRGAVPETAVVDDDGGLTANSADWFRAHWQAALSASPAPALGDQVERCAMALCVADGGDWSDHADRPDLQAALREEWRSGACAVIAAMQPVGWRATKDGCEVGLFYDEDIARENTTDAVIEPLYALPAPPGVGG